MQEVFYYEPSTLLSWRFKVNWKRTVVDIWYFLSALGRITINSASWLIKDSQMQFNINSNSLLLSKNQLSASIRNKVNHKDPPHPIPFYYFVLLVTFIIIIFGLPTSSIFIKIKSDQTLDKKLVSFGMLGSIMITCLLLAQ